MAVHGLRVNVTDSPTALNGGDLGDAQMGKTLGVRNRSSTSVDLGGSGVTTGVGFELQPGELLTTELELGEVLFAVGPAAGPYRLDVLRTGVATTTS